MTGRLRDKVAIVTGAGSVGPGWGNGKAAATLFAREGAKVFAVDLSIDAAAETKQIIDGGLSVDLAHHVMHALGHRIWGFSPEAFDEPGGDTPSPEALDAFARTFPHIVAVVRETTRDGGRCDADLEFDFALDLLLDGVERLHASGWRSRR